MKMTLYLCPFSTFWIFFYKKDVKRTQNLSTPKNDFGSLRKVPLVRLLFWGFHKGSLCSAEFQCFVVILQLVSGERSSFTGFESEDTSTFYQHHEIEAWASNKAKMLYRSWDDLGTTWRLRADTKISSSEDEVQWSLLKSVCYTTIQYIVTLTQYHHVSPVLRLWRAVTKLV